MKTTIVVLLVSVALHLPAVKTDATGLTLIEGLPTGDVQLTFATGNTEFK